MSDSGKRRLRIILLWAVLGLLPLALLHWLGSGAELRRYKVLLKSKGETLTLAELAVPISTDPEHVASRKVFFTNKFQLPTNQLAAMQYVASGRARTAWGADAPIVSWTAVEQQSAQVAASLETLRQALKNPAPDGWDAMVTVTNAVAPKMSYVSYRSVASGLLNDEIVALHRGDVIGALADIHALSGLSRLNRNELTLVQPMVASSVVESGLKGTWEVLQAPGLTEPQLAALQADWEQVNLFDMLEHGFQGERAHNQDLMSRVRTMGGSEFHALVEPWTTKFIRGKSTNSAARGAFGFIGQFTSRMWYENAVPMGYKIFSANEDELVQLHYFTGTLDAIHLLQVGRPWSQARDALTNTTQEVDDRFKRDPLKRLMFSRITIANSTRATEAVVQRETQRHLTITAIALMRYQRKNGKLPSELRSLHPEFLVNVPTDPLSGKALCYRLNPDSTFALYSVGMDGHDDGGTPGIGLWSGPDAVWPTVATPADESAAKSTITRK